MLSALLDALFPRRCPACGQLVQEDGFCGPCSEWAEPMDEWVEAESVPVRAAFVYEGAVRDALVRFKNSKRLEAGRTLARMALLVWMEQGEVEADVVVPVGSHPARVRERGYNPAAIIAQEVARHTRLPLVADALRRSTSFRGQKGKGARQRKQAVVGSFSVPKPERVAGKTILLIDDVVTTGATVAECRRVLLEAGAQEVLVWAVARVL